MRNIIFDTNCILRLLLNDIPEQANEVEKLLKQANRGLISISIPQIVIFEINFALQKYYSFPKAEVIEHLKSVVSTDYVKVESRQVFMKALAMYSEENVSFVDCFIAAETQLTGATLFTFDKKLSGMV